MAAIVKARDVQQYYQRKSTVDEYIQKRFRDPLNQVEHQRQVEIISDLIQEFSPQKVVEFAPGPGRITASLRLNGWTGQGISIDASREMLIHARQRMNHGSWKFVYGDLLKDDLAAITGNAELVFAIRFMLHFQEEERKRLYTQVHSILHPGGYFVFEVMNKQVVAPVRRLLGEKRYIVYDRLYARKEFVREAEENGFRVLRLYPILNHFWLQAIMSRPFAKLGSATVATAMIKILEKFISEQPYEWIAVCQKK